MVVIMRILELNGNFEIDLRCPRTSILGESRDGVLRCIKYSLHYNIPIVGFIMRF